jgi:protein-S-isoprenylcysteine O-methyltransferase Ste14
LTHKKPPYGPAQKRENKSIVGLALKGAVSHWIGLVAGLVLFAVGTYIRVRSEEKLLRATFGAKWDEYARTVPAVVPF